MKEIHDLATSLVEMDGSCRDVNFEHPTWTGVANVVESLRTSFKDGSATDSEGQPIAEQDPDLIVKAAQEHGYVHLIFDGGSGMFNRLQMFVGSEPDGSPFVEFTFFPDDLGNTENLRIDFLSWANEMRTGLGAVRYYARYEDLSWKFGDIGANSGVFLVSDTTEIGK